MSDHVTLTKASIAALIKELNVNNKLVHEFQFQKFPKGPHQGAWESCKEGVCSWRRHVINAVRDQYPVELRS